jgi:hypothetical protein
MARLCERFGESVAVDAKELSEAVRKSLDEVKQFSAAVNAGLGKSGFACQADEWSGRTEKSQREEGEDDTTLAGTVLGAPPATLERPSAGGTGGRPSAEESQAALLAGLQDISNSLVDEGISVNDILRMILETMYTGMGFHRVLFCIRDARHNLMQGKFGFGEGIGELVKDFRFSLAPASDVFHLALEKNVDILITDIDDPKIAARIPAWYRDCIPAKTFLVFPIVIKGRAVGLIYADRPCAGDIVIPEQLLGTLKALRNQAVLAIRRGS